MSLLLLTLVLVVLLGATIWRPSSALAGVISLDVLDQWAATAHPIFASHSYALNLFIGVLVAAAVALEFLRGRRTPLYVSTAWVLVLALYAYAYVSFLWAPWSPSGAEALRKAAPYLITYLVMTPLLIRSPADLQAPARLLLVLGPITLAAIAMFGNFGFRGLVVDGSGDETNALSLATYGALMIMAFAVASWRGRRLWLLLASLAVAFLGIWVVLRSQSRAPLLAAFISLVVVWLHLYPGNLATRVRTVLTSLAVFGFVGFFVLGTVPALHERWTSEQMSADLEGRFEMAGELLVAWYSDPFTLLFGLGNSASYKVVGYYPHMVLPETLGEEGVVGAALFVGVVVFAYGAFRARARALRETGESSTALGILFAFFLYSFVMSFKQGQLLSAGPLFLYAVLGANLNAAAREQARVGRPVAAGGRGGVAGSRSDSGNPEPTISLRSRARGPGKEAPLH